MDQFFKNLSTTLMNWTYRIAKHFLQSTFSAWQFLTCLIWKNSPNAKIIVPSIDILYESDNFIFINKLPDVVINDKDRSRVTVESQLATYYPTLVNPNLPFRFYFTHRLDFSTSGVLCIAKNRKACSVASQSFEQRKTKKFYLAILRGSLSDDFLRISERIGSDILESHRMATSSMPNCSKDHRNAETLLQVLERGICNNQPATKVLLRPITGRRHQLRLHCHHIGHTIVGDFTYSNKSDNEPYRMFLHAFHLVIDNKMEPGLSVFAPDPFVPTDRRNCWKPQEIVKSVDDALIELTCHS